jgi:thiamine biosynthesis protein ThiS
MSTKASLPSITVTVNGDVHRLPAGSTVQELLRYLVVPGTAAVERNLRLVPRAQHASEVLAEGDSLEVVQLVGGG